MSYPGGPPWNPNQPPQGYAQPWQPQGPPPNPPNNANAKAAAIVIAFMVGACCLYGRSKERPGTPAPTAPTAAPEPAAPVGPQPEACPADYPATITSRLREFGCVEGRRGRQTCSEWFLAINRVEPECFVGHRRVRVVLSYPFRSDQAVAVAREVGNQAYVAVLRESGSQLPVAQVRALDGTPLCTTFDGSPRCITRIGEIFGR